MKDLTYISLFSSAGIGCYGFKMQDFECVATNELIEKRMDIQKANKKCKFETGYINGDITKQETKDLIFAEIKKWTNLDNKNIDVVIATPPCQGMSIANRKRNEEKDLNRNSLVVESIEIIKDIHPNFFIFENVPAFLHTLCTDKNGELKEIETVIKQELGDEYVYYGKTINFKNYGSNSSRQRTLVIGVLKKFENLISPIELFPSYSKEKTLRQVIGSLKSLENGEIDNTDIYHQARVLSEEMISWIKDIKEGQSAFDNEDPLKRPHKIINGQIIENQRKLSGKYTRLIWDKVGNCIHTRSDAIASQNTIHPCDNRVLSVRELMLLMTIPNSFRWVNTSENELNNLSLENKIKFLKKNEMTIRKSIGEAVPTEIFLQIAKNIKSFLLKEHLKEKEIKEYAKELETKSIEEKISFLKQNINTIDYYSLSRILELANPRRENTAAFYTNKKILNKVFENLPDFNKDIINIIEPSVGLGVFLPYIIKKYEDKEVYLDLFDIDNNSLDVLKIFIKNMTIPQNVHINILHTDTLLYKYTKRYDLFIGNPPFNHTTNKEYEKITKCKYSKNMMAHFFELGLKISDYIVFITPKNILNVDEYSKLRNKLSSKKIDCIIDCGEIGFKDVLIETVCIYADLKNKPTFTKIISLSQNIELKQKQNYIFDKKMPYWIIYRNKTFDDFYNNMVLGIFNVFRDRQITNSNTTKEKKDSYIRVIRSRNISDTGDKIINIENYDRYISPETLKDLTVFKYLDAKSKCNEKFYLVPNMTYYPRMIEKPKNTVVNGSVAILSSTFTLDKEDMELFSTDEFRNFYKIARNYQTRSLNIDSTSVTFFGVKKDKFFK